MANGEKLFENTTSYSTDDYIEFLKFHNKKFSIYYMLYTAFWVFLFLFCIVLSFRYNSRIQGVFITILLVSFVAYRTIKPNMIVDNEMKSDKYGKDSANTFSFYDKDFEIENNKGKFKYKYSIFRKVYETDDFFYLYVTKENAFLVSKNTFSLGNATNFAKFMKQKCGFKYKTN